MAPPVVTAFDRARAALRAAAAPPEILRVAALLGPPREVPGLADAIAKAGTPIRDFEGGEHVVASVTRFNFGTKAKPSHLMLGLVATGQWARSRLNATSDSGHGTFVQASSRWPHIGPRSTAHGS